MVLFSKLNNKTPSISWRTNRLGRQISCCTNGSSVLLGSMKPVYWESLYATVPYADTAKCKYAFCEKMQRRMPSEILPHKSSRNVAVGIPTTDQQHGGYRGVLVWDGDILGLLVEYGLTTMLLFRYLAHPQVLATTCYLYKPIHLLRLLSYLETYYLLSSVKPRCERLRADGNKESQCDIIAAEAMATAVARSGQTVWSNRALSVTATHLVISSISVKCRTTTNNRGLMMTSKKAYQFLQMLCNVETSREVCQLPSTLICRFLYIDMTSTRQTFKKPGWASNGMQM